MKDNVTKLVGEVVVAGRVGVEQCLRQGRLRDVRVGHHDDGGR